MKRCNKFVLEAEKGITFEVSDGADGEIIIRAVKVSKDTENYGNYKKPYIPKGYNYVCGEWNNGFVIERLLDKSQFVWIPVGSLDEDGTLDGTHFDKKFGRRNYRKNEFSKDEFHEMFSGEIIKVYKSVRKYGGFYISRYNISKNKKTGEPQSIQGERPWTNIDYEKAKYIASKMDENDTISTHLTYGAEYDSILAWLIKSKAKKYEDIVKDSTEWGNHWNTSNSPRKIVKTGSCERWKANNIYDLAGNVDEWTMEKNSNSYRVIRGAYYYNNGRSLPVSFRSSDIPSNCYQYTSFRVAMYMM